MLGRPWYKKAKLKVYVTEYESEKEATKEANRAAKYGWRVQGADATEGHINVGRTALKVAVFSPLALVTGASRTEGKIVITYVRD